MIYETFDPSRHDARKVAKLMYDVDFRTFDLLFKNSDKAISTIEKELKKEESFDDTKVLLDDDNNVIGLLVYWISKKPAFYHCLKTTSLKLLIINILDYFVLCDVEKGDFHVAELAIDESQRGKGLGTKILNDVISYAKKNNLKRVTLDADFRNTGAKALYERLGFREFNKKRVKIRSFERGMHNMELKL
jgi:ribosomal protein S18 acetylase RimI-like enzyme